MGNIANPTFSMTGLSIQKLSMRFDVPGAGHVQAFENVSLDLPPEVV